VLFTGLPRTIPIAGPGVPMWLMFLTQWDSRQASWGNIGGSLMARTQEDTHIYGAVNSLEDLRRINQEIRQEMDTVTAQAQLTELKKRSDYLCTLAEAPSWQEKFGQRINRVREVAQEEDAKTTQHANKLAKKHGWDTEYHSWGGRSK
jgi:hypothetical protein